ncbi:MAG: hypothetical protein ACREMD_01560 [Gemmatimonadota bacterium]
MTRFTSLLGIVALLALAAPVAAQEEEPAGETPDSLAEETPDTIAEETPDEVASTHDWEFVLQPDDAAADATATVMVTEGDPENTFVVEVTGLPAVDDLDDETRDVNAYTVWIAPSRDKVKEATLAGSLSVDPQGNAMFEGTTELDTFGILILATENGAPESLSGVPVLTGIPATETDEVPAAEPQPEPGVEPQPEPGVEPQPEPGMEPEPETPQR